MNTHTPLALTLAALTLAPLDGGDGLRVLKVEGAMPIEGGIPLLVNGKIIGGIGVSGVTPQQDGQIAQAGVDALK